MSLGTIENDDGARLVRDFVEKRNMKDVQGALELMSSNCILGHPRGYEDSRPKIERYLRDEGSFLKRSYLDPSIVIKKLDDGTYSRVYRYNTGMTNYIGPGLFSFLGIWFRELYFVKDGKIRCVCCFRLYTT